MVHEHEEWLALVSIVEKLLGVLGHKTSRITLLTTPFVVGCVATEHWIPVSTLVVEGVIIVEAFRSGLEMPLAYHGCLISRLLHQFADKGACRVNALVEHTLTVMAAVETCDETGTGR